jgi:hypothetical protein
MLDEAQQANAELTAILAPFTVYTDLNSDWQAGWDY